VNGERYPEVAADERTMLEQFLDFHRASVVAALDGLVDSQVHLRVLPATELTVGGIVKHLAAMEDLWFSRKLLGASTAEPWRSAPFEEDFDWDFHSAVDDSVDDIRSLYLRSCDASRQSVAGIDSLDALAAAPAFGDERASLRWIFLHMIEETAQHRGHLDLLRDAFVHAK